MTAMVVFLLAAGNANPVLLTPVDVMPEERPVMHAEPVEFDIQDIAFRESRVLVGQVDTIGGTTYDWQTGMCIWRYLENAPEHGLHAIWLYSAELGNTTFPDRNNRYNFYDHSLGRWNWADSADFVRRGVNTFPERHGWGNVAHDPATGVAVVSGHVGTPLHVEVARDIAPGAGTFEICDGRPGLESFRWAVVRVGASSTIHIHCILDDSPNPPGDNYYSRATTWCDFSQATAVAPPEPDPDYPDHNSAASRVSEKVCLTWVYSPDGYSRKPGFYKVSTDGGATWGRSTPLGWPPAFQGDTLPSYHITSLYPFYDLNDVLHIVAGVTPFIRDTNYIMPAEIWHWCPENEPPWHRIRRAGCAPENLRASIGYNATYACRPTIGEDSRGNLYVAWEQFDSLNVDPVTNRLRAGIFVSASPNNGYSWTPGLKIAGGDSVSHRFPSVVDLAIDDSTTGFRTQVWYMDDLVAGFFVMGEHSPGTVNPIIVHDVSLTGVEEEPRQERVRSEPRTLHVTGALRAVSPGTLLDITGRKVKNLRPGLNDVRHIAPGIYFLRDDSAERPAVRRVVIAR